MPSYLKRIIIIFVLALIFAVVMYFINEAGAHGLETEQSKTVGDYLIELAYVTPTITANEPLGFTFRLADIKDKKPVSFDVLSVNVKARDEKVIVSANLAEDFIEGQARLVVAFAEPGTHHFELTFIKNERDLVESIFEVSVEPPLRRERKFDSRSLVLGGTIGVILGAIGVWLLKRKV